MQLLNRILLCSILCVLTVSSVSAQNIRVQGIITSIPSGKPIRNVRIVYNDLVISSSDADGKFTVRVPRDANLKFYEGGHNEINISVDGRQQLSITMTERMLVMEEVLVVAKAIAKKLTVEPTDIEVKGHYFHLKTRFRIPSQLLTTDYRYIVQPTVYDVTKQKRQNLRPVVIDGANYSIVQHRYLKYDKSNDKLNPYIVPNDVTKDNDIYSYADSMYFDRADLNNDFRADCYLTLVTYRPSRHQVLMDSITIAKGTQNVMRFFNYSLPPMNLDKSYITSGIKASLAITKVDSVLIPKPELQLMADRGLTEIEFEQSRATIDYSNATNKKNIEDMIAVLQSVQDNEDATIQSISMIGYTSPDGSSVANQRLADRRIQELLKVVTASLSPDILEHISLSTKGVVEKWSRVADLVERDSLPFAKKIRDIVTKVKVDHQQWAIRRLPEYRKIIVPHYLPQLRRIEYSIDYSVFRDLTDAEIIERYDQNMDISRYEYFKLILSVTDDKERELIEDDAISSYPDFIWALNRVAIRTLLQDSTNLEIQAAVLGVDAPMSMVYNQCLMALKENNILIADSLINTISDHPEVSYPKAVISALNGDYVEAFPVISERGGLNKILLLLGMKYNTQAYDQMKVLIQSPEYMQNAEAWYIYAISANRCDDLSLAMMALEKALKLDPLLARFAAIDSDIMDIYELIKPKGEEGSSDE